MYFKDFPQFLYDFNYGDRVRTSVVVDVTRNVRFKKEILSNIALYDEYDIVDGETPEIISEKFYGTPEYHWVIMIANGKYDYRKDFPLPESVLQKHIKTSYNPVLHSREWGFTLVDDQEGRPVQNQKLNFKIYDNNGLFDPAYITAPLSYTVSGKTDTMSFKLDFNFPDVRGGEYHNDLDVATQTFFQILKYQEGTIAYSTTSDQVFGVNTMFTDLLPGMDLYDWNNQLVGRIKSIETDSHLTLMDKALDTVNSVEYYARISGNPVGELTVTTDGRENNPVYFVNMEGNIVNPSETAIPVTGDTIHRKENDQKRRIKIISPSLIESILRNYEDQLR